MLNSLYILYNYTAINLAFWVSENLVNCTCQFLSLLQLAEHYLIVRRVTQVYNGS